MSRIVIDKDLLVSLCAWISLSLFFSPYPNSITIYLFTDLAMVYSFLVLFVHVFFL